MIYKPLYAIVLLCATYCSFAQTSDQFSDGNFSASPLWTGDDSLFQVNSFFQLQSKGTTSKDISLSSSVVPLSEMEWQCFCKFNLSPSTSNFCRYYLWSDTPNLKGNLNGYYVQLGGVSGNTDSITLYKQRGSTRTRIIAGRPGTVGKSTNTLRIKILRDAAGSWQLYSDTTGGYSFALEGTSTDTTSFGGGFVGVFVKYTSGNAFNYFFDDVYAGPRITDTQVPVIDSILVNTATQLRLVFSETVDAATALSAENYMINNGVGSPVSVDFEPGKTNCVILELNDPLINQSYDLVATGIADMNGNVSASQKSSFVYNHYVAAENDIVIAEFFPDPTPPIGLPETEFVELYNPTPTTINLAGWSISDGTTTALFGNVNIAPDGFIIVCSASSANSFKPYGNIATINSLPSLNNTSDQLILKDASGKTIHQLRYDLSWYANMNKQDGGYTIEMNNPMQLCKGKQNYAASDAIAGGTPGSQNSRWNNAPDTIAPVLANIIVNDSVSLSLVFNERMDSLSLLSAPLSVSGSSIRSRSISLSRDTLRLQLASSLAINNISTLAVNNARDCSGNIMMAAIRTFTCFIPQQPNQFDVLIHEIMADPEPPVQLPNSEYIELYNRSAKVISLHNWTLSDVSSTATLPAFIIQPDSFVVVTASANVEQFRPANNIIGVNGFPSPGNDGDALTLKDGSGKVIHHVAYTSDAYRDNQKKNGGWSLEMCDSKNPCGGDNNLAPSMNSAGGTPGFSNSVKHSIPDIVSPKLLNVYPLSPTLLQLRFSEPLDSLSLIPPEHYHCASLASFPANIQLVAPDYTKVNLLSTDSFEHLLMYRLLVDSVTDCAGNVIESFHAVDFGMPETLDSGDIAINELLFDPYGNGSDFVEIVNRTDKILDLKNVWIANADDQNKIKELFPIDSTGWLLFPKMFVVLTDNPASLLHDYFTPYSERVVQSKLPSFPNDAGRCVLLNTTGTRLDQLDYSDNMHYPLLDTKDGVSLERIDWNRKSDDASNWTSASSTSGYATPTYQNSQYAYTQKGNDVLHVAPEVFSPDDDGFNDHATFTYSLPQPDYTGNMYIYNATGTLVKHLLRNEILGTTGSFGWDGFTVKGEKASTGIYLYYFEAFNLKGDVVKMKSTLVVGAKL